MSVVSPKESMLLLAQMLLMQGDFPGLLHMFHEVCFSFLPYTFASLAVETTFIHDCKLYFQDTLQKNITETALPATYIELCRQNRLRFFETSHVEHVYPLLADLAKDERGGETHVCLMPLRIPLNGYHATLLLWIEKKTDTEHVLMLRRIVNGVFSVAVARILERREVAKDIDAIRRERDLLVLLQGITACAQTCSDVVSFLDQAAQEVCRFFGVSAVALYLIGEGGRLSLTCAKRENEEGPRPRAVSLRRDESLLSEQVEFGFSESFSETWISLSQKTLEQRANMDPAAAYFLDRGCSEVCAFPIHLRGAPFAVLLVGAQSSLLTDVVIANLEQVAFCLAPVLRSFSSEAEGEVQEGFEELAFEPENVANRPEYADLVGQSKSLSYVLAQVDLVAQTDSTVLLLGETGTGKELIARAVHKRSSRAGKNFITLNCAAVPRDLLESELFGHEKGAFTGATSQHKGRFERAQGGTLFLDEIGELPVELQPKLLRILQTREMERVGGQTLISLDVRIVAATNRDLKKMVELGQFRDDLYYRLNVFPIHIPPLRERKGDIPLLVHTYTKRFAERMQKNVPTIPKRVMAWFCEQEWPGNIRELTNVVERAVIMTSGTELVIPFDVASMHFTSESSTVSKENPVHIAQDASVPIYRKEEDAAKEGQSPKDERERIIAAVLASNGVIAGPRGAAARLGLKRTTLLSRMRRLNLSVKSILDASE